MKKLLAIFLTLSVMIGALIVPISAEGEQSTPPVIGAYAVTAPIHTIGASDTTVKIGEVTYSVIRTVDQFKAISGTTNYILANNIDFAGAEHTTSSSLIAAGWSGILEGNGYSVYGISFTSASGTGFFDCMTSHVDIQIKNITFGMSTAPISMISNGNGGIGVITGNVKNTSTVYVENCTVYVNITKNGNAAQTGAFVGCIHNGNNGCKVNFVNCTAYGTINVGNQTKVGGFMGNNYSTSPVTFTNCRSDVNVSGGQFVGGFIGLIQSPGPVTFTNCVSNGTITTTTDTSVDNGPGGFVGKSTGNVAFSNCTFGGSLAAASYTPTAGFYICYQQKAVTFTVTAPTCVALTNICAKQDSAPNITYPAHTPNTEALPTCTVCGLYNTAFGYKEAQTLLGANMTVGTTLDVNYYAILESGYTDAQVRFTVDDEETVVDGVLDATTGEYVFKLTAIAPQLMGENIKAELILGETVLDTQDTFSVKSYLEKIAPDAIAPKSIAIDAEATTVTIDSVTYNVIRTAADFKAMTGTDVNYILAGNIDFATDGNDLEVTTLITGWTGILEGNGYSLLNYKVTTGENGGLFDLYNVGTITIRNLTIGSATDPIIGLSTNSNGGMAAICGRMKTGSILNAQNVQLYFNTVGSTKYCIGGFVGQLGGATLNLTDCTVNGVLETSAGKVAGFVGNGSSGTINLTYCTANVTVNGASNADTLVGQKGATLTVVEKSADAVANEKLTALVADMLTYGAEAQKYTGFKTDALVDAKVTAATKYTALTAESAHSLVTAEGVTLGETRLTSVNAWFDSTNKLIVKYTVADGETALIAVDGVAVAGTLVEGTENTYVVEIAVSAVDFSKDYVITISIGGTLVQTLTFSVEAYVYAMQDNASIGALVKALYNYGLSAAAYNA